MITGSRDPHYGSLVYGLRHFKTRDRKGRMLVFMGDGGWGLVGGHYEGFVRRGYVRSEVERNRGT
jgi:hypothetical protein